MMNPLLDPAAEVELTDREREALATYLDRVEAMARFGGWFR